MATTMLIVMRPLTSETSGSLFNGCTPDPICGGVKKTLMYQRNQAGQFTLAATVCQQ
jgi:hypothetical protein